MKRFKVTTKNGGKPVVVHEELTEAQVNRMNPGTIISVEEMK